MEINAVRDVIEHDHGAILVLSDVALMGLDLFRAQSTAGRITNDIDYVALSINDYIGGRTLATAVAGRYAATTLNRDASVTLWERVVSRGPIRPDDGHIIAPWFGWLARCLIPATATQNAENDRANSRNSNESAGEFHHVLEW